MVAAFASQLCKKTFGKDRRSSWKPRFEVCISPLESNASCRHILEAAKTDAAPTFVGCVKGQVPEKCSADLQKLESNVLVQ